MSDDYREGGFGGCFGSLIVSVILGWIVYGGLKAGLLVALISLAVGVLAFVAGVIPLLGPIGYWFAANMWVMPLFPHFGLEYSWLTTLYFWGGLITSIFVNIGVVIFAINAKN